MNTLTDWAGRQRRTDALLNPWPARALHASLDLPGEPPLSELPLPWHWLYFLETPGRGRQGRDGHPRTGDFFPPIEQPRRMFVGGRSELLQPLRLGAPARLVETILRCEPKEGAAGAMTLISVGYEYSQDGECCLREERDFMYLRDRMGAVPEPRVDTLSPVPDAPLTLDVASDPVLLFKFSALTFNGHRIHYDSDYAREVEAYPATVVHGPLTALLLAHLAGATNGRLSEFSFRARRPLFCGDLLRLRGEAEGERLLLRAFRPDGEIAMTAEAQPC